ncbi:hypothetical protein FRC04_007761 [Tulasnella sp. 424]|nr:hypothetical protein FRC04_007761 [Tulasnella sp. 424]
MDVAVKILKPVQPTSMSLRLSLITSQRIREKNGSLVSYLDNNPNLSRPKKIQLLEQITHGLAFLHSQSPPICHADIKPENVLINDLCEATLSDFGLSRVIQEIDISTGFTTGDGPKGSQRFMAPELFEEDNPKPTLGTDIYAFGGLVLAVMSGSPPFAHIKAPAKVMFRIISEEHPKPEEHPKLERNDPLWSLMALCWAREPKMRPTISDVKVELKSRNEPTQPTTATPLVITSVSGDPYKLYRMYLNTIEQRGYATFKFEVTLLTLPTGPTHNLTWVATVTITGVAPSLSGFLPVGITLQGAGPTKNWATDTAAEQMLNLLATHGVEAVPRM